MLDASIIEEAKSVDLVELAGRYTELRQESRQGEYSGPCPRCGGDDRFHVRSDGKFFCRHCHEQWGDAIDFIQWAEGLTFREAVRQLVDESSKLAQVKKVSTAGRAQSQDKSQQDDDWRRQARRKVEDAHRRLWDGADASGRIYLLSRGLTPRSWRAFRLGYSPAVSVPRTLGRQRAPAITIPWYAWDGRLCGIRYRFLEPQGKCRQTAMYGSEFGGTLFGVQALQAGSRPDLMTLVLVEGELNAASIWQAAEGTRLDVLSLGSQGQRITDEMVTYMSRYRHCIVWLDKAEHAAGIRAKLPSALALQSPEGKDANDLLQHGLLGGFLADVRCQQCADDADDADGERLLWDLYDRGFIGLGLDEGMATIVNELASKLGKPISLRRVGDVWRTGN